MAMERLENLSDEVTERWSDVRAEEELVERGGWICSFSSSLYSAARFACVSQ